MVPGYSADADADATTECLQLHHPQRRRRSATRDVAVHPNCACGAPGVCVVWWWWCVDERASNGHRSGGYLDLSAADAAEYARANEVLCGALWPQAAQQALQRVSVSSSHMLAADLGAAFGAAASVLPVGDALNKGSVALGLREGGFDYTD